MEEYIGCYDSVNEIVDEATNQFGKNYVLNEEKHGKLQEVCAAIDSFVEEIDCDFVDVTVDFNIKRLVIDIGCDDMVLHGGRNNQFFSLIQMLDSFSFSKTKNGALCIALNVDNMWERMRG